MMKFNIDDKNKHKRGIYIIRSTATTDSYVGMTANFYKRYQQHLNGFKRGTTKAPKLKAYIDKYGYTDLIFELKWLVGIHLGNEMRPFEKIVIAKVKPTLNQLL